MESFKLELGEMGEDGVQRYLLTLQTDGSFEVTFSIKDKLLAFVGQSIASHAAQDAETAVDRVALNS